MKILIRVDASSNIGNGHLMRCLTLARALKKKEYDITFLCNQENKDQIKSLIKNDFSIIYFNNKANFNDNNDDYQLQDAIACAKAIASLAVFDLCIVDHYNLSKPWQLRLSKQTKRMMVIDDLANREHYADILLDQSLGRQDCDYQKIVPKHCLLLTGSKYILLRSEFITFRKESINSHLTINKIEKVLISLGGTDPNNITEKVVKALISLKYSIPALTAKVILASNAPHISKIKNYSQKYSWITLLIDTQEMAKQMLSADLAIGASGSTAWERCCLGLPTLSIITASNQEFISRKLEDENAHINLGFAKSLTTTNIVKQVMILAEEHGKYNTMVRNSNVICDGLGVQRVVDKIELTLKNDTSLILATADDCATVYKWQSKPELRKYSRNSKPIEWQEHQIWFANTLQSNERTLFIINFSNTPCGILRLDTLNENTQEISILLSTSHHGNNIACNAIKSIPLQYKKRDIIASVHPDNTSSHKLFTRAGFTKVAADQYLLPATF